MKRKIAMRCTQEQFDSIKDRINLPIDIIGRFDEYPYLTNDYAGNKEVGITRMPAKRNREIHETFNADVFLEACGVGVEKIFNHTELQWRDERKIWNDYTDSSKNYEWRLKPQPDYSKEIEALQQKAKENGMSVELIWSKL